MKICYIPSKILQDAVAPNVTKASRVAEPVFLITVALFLPSGEA